MKQVYIHFDQNKKKIERSLLAILILMFLHGVYKNALSYVIINKLDLITCLSLLLYPIITILWAMIFTKRIKLCLSDYIEALVLCIMIPPRFSLILFSLMTFLYYGVKKKLAKNLTTQQADCRLCRWARAWRMLGACLAHAWCLLDAGRETRNRRKKRNFILQSYERVCNFTTLKAETITLLKTSAAMSPMNPQTIAKTPLYKLLGLVLCRPYPL